MRKKHIKTISMLISLAISEITSIQVNAQTWNGNGYYFSRNLDDIKSDDEINESDFDYKTIMDWLTYKNLCCFNLDTGVDTMGDVWFPIAIYTSVDRAVYQIDALNYEDFYLSMANSRIKDAYQLIDGRPVLIEDVSQLDEIDKDNLAFSLVQEDLNANEQIVGYINGKDMVAMALPSMNNYKKEKELVKIMNY